MQCSAGFDACFWLLRAPLAGHRCHRLLGVAPVVQQCWLAPALAAVGCLNWQLTGALQQQQCPASPAVYESCHSLVYCRYSTAELSQYWRCSLVLDQSIEAACLPEAGLQDSRSIKPLLPIFMSFLHHYYHLWQQKCCCFYRLLPWLLLLCHESWLCTKHLWLHRYFILLQ